MMRVIILVALSLALLDTAWSAPATCAAQLEKVSYETKELRALLVARNGTLLGTVSLTVEDGKKRRCFLATFSALERTTLRLEKLRAGIFTAGNQLPSGKERFTRRKSVGTVGKASMRLCPERIHQVVEREASCCGLLEVLAFAVLTDRGKAIRGYLAPSVDTPQPCRITDTNKPFRYACTVENFCNELGNAA
ncbi:hypothetical protein NDN08_004849 [Rhodosorus marinus]|uniref:Uncharacterized protein n=1 Tax=Rhodosorus marinus TaxID=101924 RepID=A0AAV8UI78_9RHOD|nr:hypothetical protein NDN08_004849 [Rhodosorus marinus]